MDQKQVHNIATKGEMIVDSLKVSSRSNPNSVAGALVAVIREQGYAEMQAVGAGALNQAIKAIAIARGFVAPSGTDLTCSPAFTDIVISGEDRTALKLLVEKDQNRREVAAHRVATSLCKEVWCGDC